MSRDVFGEATWNVYRISLTHLPQTPLTLDIRTLNGAVPTEPNSGPNILGSSSLPPASFDVSPQWTTFTAEGQGKATAR